MRRIDLKKAPDCPAGQIPSINRQIVLNYVRERGGVPAADFFGAKFFCEQGKNLLTLLAILG